jgi:hypothetical protein
MSFGGVEAKNVVVPGLVRQQGAQQLINLGLVMFDYIYIYIMKLSKHNRFII